MQQLIGSTGYVKVGNRYINPHLICSIQPYSILKNGVCSGTELLMNNYEYPFATFENLDCDKFAQCAVKAMQTGEVIDVMA